MNSSISITQFDDIPDNEQPFFIQGPQGKLESIFLKSKYPTSKIAILCHPHPLHEGTMHNKVIHTLSRAFHRKGIHSIRFNFRGVGKSEGAFDNSIGEVLDVKAVYNFIEKIFDKPEIYLAGFSFGSYIAASFCQQISCKQLFSIAPAVHHQPYQKLLSISVPWVVIQGEEDEVVSVKEVYDWFEFASQRLGANMTLIKIPGSSHFFHAKLIELRTMVMDAIQL